MKLDKDNPLETKVETRDGRKARIICTDAVGDRPIVVLMKSCYRGTNDTVLQHYESGKIRKNGDDDNLDIVNVREKHAVWINIYPQDSASSSYVYKTRKLADESKGSDRTERIKIIYEDGQFDE